MYHVSDMGDIKGSIACLSFILSSAAKHNVDDESLSNELQQLGLPKGVSLVSLHLVNFVVNNSQLGGIL